MEFLLDNPLAAMDGAYFLLLYVFVIFLSVTGLGYFKDRLDTSYNLEPPAIPPNVDPFETAYLRGGENELARTLVFALRQKSLIVIANGDKKAYLRPPLDSASSGLSDIERRTLEWIGTDRDVNEIFSGPGSLVAAIDRWTNLYQLQLEHRQLLMPPESIEKIRRWKWTAVSLIGGLGGYKLFAALATGNLNVIFTVLLLAGGVTAALKVGRTHRRTKLGDVYLDRLRLVFEPVRNQVASARGVEAGPVSAHLASVDPLLLSVGVFGAAALAGSLYPDYNDAFRKNQQNESAAGGGCGGGCGTGCSSGGSSSGSSCSGGSSCGSGCGGCGGGCGS